MTLTEKQITTIGWIATCTAILMYMSYIDQIRMNLDGQKGSLLLPLATTINCSLWVIYGFLKKKKDWPIIVANFPGVVLGLTAFITAL